MKLIRNPWVLSAAAVLGVSIAACSSKTTDNGTEAGGSPPNGGTANGGGGGISATTTGGKTSTPGNSNTGGRVVVPSATGGSGACDPLTYCNGLFKNKVCSTTTLQADVRTVNMLIVLDESGSMSASPTSGAASKWDIMKNALNTALTAVENDINFGLLLFPYLPGGISSTDNTQADNCAVPNDPAAAVNVPIATGPTGLQNVLDKVASQAPGGGTPTAAALAEAYKYFVTGDGRNLSGSKWVLLATDGGPNCNAGLTCTKDTCTQNLDLNCGDHTANTTINCCDGAGYICLDDTSVTNQIAQLAAAGINTFVIGVPGSEPYSAALNNFAIAGGKPNPDPNGLEKYYAISATSAQQDLVKAFGDITTQLVRTCDIELSETPKDNALVNVAIDCVPWKSVPTGSPADAGVDGYYIDNTKEPAHLKLVGAPCNNIMTNGANKIDVIEGCTGIN